MAIIRQKRQMQGEFPCGKVRRCWLWMEVMIANTGVLSTTE